MPKLLEMGFETEQGMVGTPAVLFGIVSYPGPFLFPVDCNHHRIYIENQGGALRGKTKQISPETVVEPDQPADCLGRQAFQKPAQGGLVREAGNSQHLQEGAVVLQDFGLVDTPKTHDNGKHQSQKKFGRMVTLISLGKPDVILQMFLQTNLFAKTLNQPHPAEVGNVGFVEGKIDFLGSFWHDTQNTFLRRFVR